MGWFREHIRRIGRNSRTQRETCPDMTKRNSATLVAIAKNEEKYIIEWIAYNFAIGFDKVIIFSNDSTDRMCDLITQVSKSDDRVALIDWPSIDGVSPQISAYNHALSIVKSDWVTFIDIDEFIVPFRTDGIKDYLDQISDSISSVHINWRNFGSSNQQDDSYELVTQTFTKCASPDWGNNRHFKSIARVEHIFDVHIHDIATTKGLRVLSDMKEFVTESRGLSERVAHDGIQVNHYQCKTYPEFCKRMLRGDANYASKTARDHSMDRYSMLDRNEDSDDKIRKFDRQFFHEYGQIKQRLI